MADDTEMIPETLDFHPCDTPRGMLYYKLNDLTFEQRKKINQYKLQYVKNNQKYLKDHPEVRKQQQFILFANSC